MFPQLMKLCFKALQHSMLHVIPKGRTMDAYIEHLKEAISCANSEEERQELQEELDQAIDSMY